MKRIFKLKIFKKNIIMIEYINIKDSFSAIFRKIYLKLWANFAIIKTLDKVN